MTHFLLGCLIFTWFLPLLACLAALACWRTKAQRLTGFLAVGLAVVSLLACLPLLYKYGLGNTEMWAAQTWPWMALDGSPPIQIGYLLDRFGVQLLALLALLAFLIQVFSLHYMRSEANSVKYFASLNLFVFAMNSLILSNGLLQTFAAWELIGVSSWLLIGFWSTQTHAAAGALRAMLFNRLADVAFLCGLLLLMIESGASTWTDVMAVDGFQLSTFPAVLLVIGAAGKSAQGPFACWLPGAMAGPTPVSALLHAATLVVAGVFLLVRSLPILPGAALLFIAALGCLTLLGGSLYALQSRDIKQVLAGSTLSQLGLMFVALGTGEAQWAFLHLLTHGFFKFGLFLCVAVISKPLHHLQNPYDFKHYGGLAVHQPVLFAFYLVCASGLLGLPLTAGYLSKELLIDSILHQEGMVWWVFQVITWGSVALTAAYMTRHGYLIFVKQPQRFPIEQPKPIAFHYIFSAAFVLLGCLYFWLNPFSPFDFSKLLLVGPQINFPDISSLHSLILVLLTLLSVLITYILLHRNIVASFHPRFFQSGALIKFELGMFYLIQSFHYIERLVLWMTVEQPVRILAGLRLGSSPEAPSNWSLVGLVRFTEERIRAILEHFLPFLLRLFSKPAQWVSASNLQTYILAGFIGFLALIYFLVRQVGMQP